MHRTGKYLLFWLAHFIGVVAIFKILNLISPQCFLNCVSSFLSWVACLIIAKFTFVFTKRKFLEEKVQPEGKAIFITGCDSGFGHHIAKRLDTKGFHVYASCLLPSGPGAEELRKQCSEKLKVLELDVTKDESVEKAMQYVKNSLGSLELWAIINNAGIAKGFSTDLASLEHFKATMEVNGFGVVRVTKAFLPLLKLSRGRVVNLTSANGRIAEPLKSPYVMSKHAASGFSDCLRMELDVWGIRVIQVEPEIFQTMITDIKDNVNRFDSEMATLDPNLRDEYGEKFFKNTKMAIQIYLEKLSSPKIFKVVDALESAVSSEYPDIIYRPSRNNFVRIIIYLFEMLPYGLKDLLIKYGSYPFSFPKPGKA